MNSELSLDNAENAHPENEAEVTAPAASPSPNPTGQSEAKRGPQRAAPKRYPDGWSITREDVERIDFLSRWPGRPCNPNRPRSNVARLSREIREFVNVALRQGMDYREIVLHLRTLAGPEHGVTPSILSRWFKTGYQEWLRQTTRLENTIAQSDAALTRLARLRTETGADPSDLLAAFLSSLVQKTLEDFDPAALQALLADKPAEIFRLIACLNDHIAARSRQQQADVARIRCQLEVAEKDKATRKEPVPARNLMDAEIIRQAYGTPLEQLMKAYKIVPPGDKPKEPRAARETRESDAE